MFVEQSIAQVLTGAQHVPVEGMENKWIHFLPCASYFVDAEIYDTDGEEIQVGTRVFQRTY